MVQNNDVQQKKMIHTWGCESATVEYYEGKKTKKQNACYMCIRNKSLIIFTHGGSSAWIIAEYWYM